MDERFEIGMYIKIDGVLYQQKKFMKLIRRIKDGKEIKGLSEINKMEIINHYELIMENNTINKILTRRQVNSDD